MTHDVVTASVLLDEIHHYLTRIRELAAELSAREDLSRLVEDGFPVVALPLWAARHRVIARLGTIATARLGEVSYHIHGNGMDFVVGQATYGCNLAPYPPRDGVTHITFSVVRLHAVLASKTEPSPSVDEVGEALLGLLEQGKLARTDWPFGGPYRGGFYIPVE